MLHLQSFILSVHYAPPTPTLPFSLDALARSMPNRFTSSGASDNPDPTSEWPSGKQSKSLQQASVSILDPKNQDPPKSFTFDSVFDWNCRQLDVYNTTARPIVESVLNGYNGTIFAYGQTGTGKTFSMEGVRDVPELRGIIPNAFEHIFAQIQASPPTTQYLVRASYLEIYNEDIRDLLNPKAGKLDVKERSDVGVYIKDLRTFVIKDVDEMDRLMSFGNKNRSVGATEMNATSSRSHSIFTITVEASEKGDNVDDESRIRAGKLHLVDLAGSERQSKTGATGDRLKEATKINLSLSALGNVISALVDGKSSHIPYRDSKLTRLLQDSLGGNARTLMIATLSPASYNYDETLSTLRYANRAKNIKNKPKVNEDPKDAMLREFQEEIRRLKQELEAAQLNTIDGPEGQVRVIEEIEEVEEVEEVDESGTGSDDTDPESSTRSLRPRTKESKRKRRKAKQPSTGAAQNDEGPRAFRGVPKEKLAEMAAEVEREKQAILQDKGLEESEKDRLLEEAEKRGEELENEKKARDNIAAKLAQLEQKLLVGGVSLVDKETQIQNAMAARAAELEERARKERELKRELEEHEEINLQIEEEFSSLQEEASSKTRKLKKLWNLLISHRSEIKDLQEEHQREREGLLDTIRELTIELKLKMLMINSFVPEEELQAVEERADYDEAAEKWRIQYIAHAGNNIRGKRSLISGKILGGKGLHREHDHHLYDPNHPEDYEDDESERWDPMSAFPDPYLTYDVPTEKRKKATGSSTVSEGRGATAGGGATTGGGGNGSGNARKARPASAHRRSPTKSASTSSGGGASGRGAGGRGGGGLSGDRDLSGSLGSGEFVQEHDPTAAPSARGLVSKGRHYA
ncbi:Kinesin-like protein kif3a [Dinochytrium kinnereticum]|nr:Kinesin-like protein kif3a [Dinochytrium kinnereticum]